MGIHPDIVASFEHRREHAWNKIRWSVPASVRRGKFLDIGCGIGNGLVAALQHGFESAVGIDRDFKEFTWFNIADFDPLAKSYDVDPAKALLIEADLFTTKFAPASFDCVFLLDSIEHVPDPKAFIEQAAQYVAPGGVLLIDTCPLFYSKVGHHLFNHLSPATYPWAHLRPDFLDLVKEHAVDDWSWQRFDELNKVTHRSVRDAVIGSGLKVIFEHRGAADATDAALLDKHRANLDLTGVPYEAALLEDWLLIVSQRS